MRFVRRLAALLIGTGAAASVAAAQTPRGLTVVNEGERQGFWAALGLGAGAESYDLRDGFGYSSTLTEPTVSIRLGGTINQHWRLGGEALVWFHDVPGGTESMSSFLVIGQWYPMTRAGFYLKGGAGLARNGVDFSDGFGSADVGFAVLGGVGAPAVASVRAGAGSQPGPAFLRRRPLQPGLPGAARPVRPRCAGPNGAVTLPRRVGSIGCHQRMVKRSGER